MVKVLRKNLNGKFIVSTKIPSYKRNFHISFNKNNTVAHASMYNNYTYPKYKSYHYIPQEAVNKKKFTAFTRNITNSKNKQFLRYLNNSNIKNKLLMNNLKIFYLNYLISLEPKKPPQFIPRFVKRS